MRARTVQLLSLAVVLINLGVGAARADCALLCGPGQPPPGDPNGEPPPEPAPPLPVPLPPPPSPEPPPGETVSPSGAHRLLELINASRAEHGLAPMTARADVVSIAVDHSMAMAKAGDIWHNDAYFTAETKRRLEARTVGENVAMNSSIDDAHARLMASPGHRSNILNPAFVVAGIGVVQRDGGTYYITEDFLEPLAAAVPVPGPAAPPAGERQRGDAPEADAPDTALPAGSETEPAAAPREHFPNGLSTSPPRRLQAGAGPTDIGSTALFGAIALLTLVGTATAHRLRLRSRRRSWC